MNYENQLICGDCLEVMKGIPDKSIDLVVADPPYGINRDKFFKGCGGFRKPIVRRQYKDSWDNIRPSKEYFDEILRIANKIFIFGGNFFTDMLPCGRHWIVWDKCNTMPSFGDCELIWTNLDKCSVKKITCEYNGVIGKEDRRFHPTQKPEKLLRILININSNIGNIILDPFCGSGTTCVAAKMLNRRYIGIEIDPGYCKIAQQRLREIDMIQLNFLEINHEL